MKKGIFALVMASLLFTSTVFGRIASINQDIFRVLDRIYLNDNEDPGYQITRLSIGKSGKLYALSAWSYKIKIFEPDGELITTIDFLKDIPFLYRPLRPPKPNELAINSTGHIFVTAYWVDFVGRIQSGVFIFNPKGIFEDIFNLWKTDVEDLMVNDQDQIIISGVDMQTGVPKDFLWQINQSGKTLKYYFEFSGSDQNYWEIRSNNMKDRFLVGKATSDMKMIMTLKGGNSYKHITSRLNVVDLDKGQIIRESIFNLRIWSEDNNPLTREPIPDQIVDSIISIIQLKNGNLLVQRTHNNIYFQPENDVNLSFDSHLYLNILSASGDLIKSNISTGSSYLNFGILRSSDTQDNLYFVKTDGKNQTIVTKVILNF